MGRARSHEFMEYVSVIMNAICENERLVELLTPDEQLEGLSIEEKKALFKKGYDSKACDEITYAGLGFESQMVHLTYSLSVSYLKSTPQVRSCKG